MYFLYSLGGVTFNKCWITLSILNCYSPNFQGFILMKNALNNQVGMLGDMFLWLVANLKQGVIYFIKQEGGNHKIAWVYVPAGSSQIDGLVDPHPTSFQSWFHPKASTQYSPPLGTPPLQWLMVTSPPLIYCQLPISEGSTKPIYHLSLPKRMKFDGESVYSSISKDLFERALGLHY